MSLINVGFFTFGFGEDVFVLKDIFVLKDVCM